MGLRAANLEVRETAGAEGESPWRRRLGARRGAALGLLALLGFVAVAAFGPALLPHDPTAVDLNRVFQRPSLTHLLGTDNYGRDILSRVVYGSRYALAVGAAAVLISGTVGTALGMAAGLAGGIVDTVIMRVVDGWLAFPTLIIALAIVTALQPTLTNAAVAIGLAGAPWYARVARAQALYVKQLEYVTAVRSLGAGTGRIVWRHVLPNSLGPLVIQASLQFGTAILNLSALGFLGIGVQPPAPEWGVMVAEGRQYMLSGEWWIAGFPGFAIMAAVIGFNFLGDALRDWLDPRA
ncbi:MAG: ABC transporter permease [Armatimonadetes bacterium]|nr:ABC transporter permease [Armatimonadota bacterium]